MMIISFVVKLKQTKKLIKQRSKMEIFKYTLV
jgi:hypothetical protein